MRKIVILLFVFCNTIVFSQDFFGKVTYQSAKNNAGKDKKANTEEEEKGMAEMSQYMSKEDVAALMASIEKSYQKQFTLTFNKNEALFEQVQELEAPKPQTSGVSFSISMTGMGKKYINTNKKISITEENLMGDEFVIKDSLETTNWSITAETKKIGEYNCFKATRSIPVSKLEQDYYNNYLKKKEKGEKILFEQKKPEPKTITAWYTSEIPVSFGPNGANGLPGLILQLEEAELVYLCTSVSKK
jgi:GLPGLI family protein